MASIKLLSCMIIFASSICFALSSRVADPLAIYEKSTLSHDSASVLTSDGGNLKGENNYCNVKIFYHNGTIPLVVKNARLNYGKWVKSTSERRTEIGSPNGRVFTAWGEYYIVSCGRQASPTGTDGSFELYSKEDDVKVLRIYWDVSYLGMAQWKMTKFDEKRFMFKAVRIGESSLDLTIVIMVPGNASTGLDKVISM